MEVDLREKPFSIGMSDDRFRHPVTSSLARVDEPVSGDALFEGRDSSPRISLLFGEVLVAVSDKKFHVEGIGLVYSWVVDLVEDSVRDCEPDPTLVAGGWSDSLLGTQSPARGDTGPARSGFIYL